MGAERFDVVGLGCAAVDERIYVDEYPPPDCKIGARSWQRSIGGLTAVALIAAARLGARAACAGIVGTDDDLSPFVLSTLADSGVDVRYMPRVPGMNPIHAAVVVGEQTGTRNIFAVRPNRDASAVPLPSDGVIETARVLFVDPFDSARTLIAARIARAAGVPIVADLEDHRFDDFAPLFELVDHLIVPIEFARRFLGWRDADPAALVAGLWSPLRSLVAVTDGENGCWYTESGSLESVRFQPAFRVVVRDTTGCGDVFHGAYAAALAQGRDGGTRIRIAAAAAALKAAGAPGAAGVPDHAAVEALLSRTADAA